MLQISVRACCGGFEGAVEFNLAVKWWQGTSVSCICCLVSAQMLWLVSLKDCLSKMFSAEFIPDLHNFIMSYSRSPYWRYQLRILSIFHRMEWNSRSKGRRVCKCICNYPETDRFLDLSYSRDVWWPPQGLNLTDVSIFWNQSLALGADLSAP